MNNLTPVSEIIKPADLPQVFSFLETPIDNLLNNIYFDFHEVGYSYDNTTVSHTIHLVTGQEYGFTIPGLGLRFILNLNGNNTSGFWCNVSFYKGILSYLNSFRIDNFSETLESVHELASKIFPLPDASIYYRAADAFETAPGKFVDGYNRINSYCSLNNTYNSSKTARENFEILADNIFQNYSGTAWEIVLSLYIINAPGLTDEQKKERTVSLFLNGANPFEPVTYADLVSFIKDKLIPHIKATFNLVLGLEIPRKYLIPVKPDGSLETNADIALVLTLAESIVSFDSKDGIHIDNDIVVSFPPEYPMAQIGNTRIQIGFMNARIENNADDSGKKGLYIQEANIIFPAFWNHDTSNSTALIKGRNLLIGTGGFSGILSLESTQASGSALFRLGDPGDTGNHFQLGISKFLVEFKQNAIVQSDISGYMKIPGFKDAAGNPAQIDVLAHIGNNGDFRITASEKDGILLSIPEAFELIIKSLSIGTENNRWYVEASGSLRIIANISNVDADFLKQPIDIKKIRIWQDGSIEFTGGGITLPTQMHLRIGPVSLAISHLSFGSHEGVYQGHNRRYFYFGFNGELNTGPGGIEVRGDGVEFHFTRDAGPFHCYLRIAGIGVDIKIPGNASPESADVLLHGYLAMRHGTDADGNPQAAGPEYQGAIGFKIRPLKISGKGSMILRPKVPAFIVDIELDLATPISLGATGLGIYGFRGLIGNHYVASRQYIGLSDQDSWYEYLKKKVPPRNRLGVGIEKFDPARDGFSLGVGATIGTLGDDGWAFSSKVFVLLSMPEMLLIEGQANVLHKRLGIESESDPPFYAFIILDNNSVQAGIGVNYKLPDDGSILSTRGEMQLGFFFNNSSAWYVNIGKDLPEEKRLQSRLFTLFNAYSYLMINSRGIKAGAGAKFDLQKKFGPVRVGLYAFIDARGFISFRPVQIGGAIQLGGGIFIKVRRFGVELRVAAGLSAEAPKPFVIAGFIEIKIKIVFIKVRFKLEFTWIFNKQVNTDEVKLLDPADFLSLAAGETARYPFKAINMLTEEAFVLKYIGDNLSTVNPDTDSSWNNYIIPMDSYIDLEFKRPVKPYNGRYGGGISPVPEFTEYIAPQQGRMPQVKHTYSVENVEIRIWNRTTRQWESYNPWEALSLAFQNAGLTVNTGAYDFGYWQYNNVPGRYTSLRLLSQTPFSVSNGTAPEQLGLHSQHILCEGKFQGASSQYWNTISLHKKYPAGKIFRDRDLLLRFGKQQGSIDFFPNVFGIDPSLKVEAADSLEIYFKAPMPAVKLYITAINGARISFFTKTFNGGSTLSGLPSYEYQLTYQHVYTFQELMQEVLYENPDNPVAKILIEANECYGNIAYEDFITPYWPMLYNSWMGDHSSMEQWQQDQVTAWLSLYGAGAGQVEIIGFVEIIQQWNEALANGDLSPLERDTVENWINNYSTRTDYRNVQIDLCNEWTNILQNYPDYPVLYSYVFNWKEVHCDWILGTQKFDYCSLYLHGVCWFTPDQWAYNLLLSQYSQGMITTGMNSLSQAINEALPAIWRPDSAYAIMITTKDDVNPNGAPNTSSGGYPYIRKFAVGFKTAGALGFFHQTQLPYQQLEQQNKADQYKLSGLRYYIDYQRSYPNANGNLIGAKPLYYKQPKLSLFFIKPYVYEFFTRWDSYKGNPGREYQLLSTIVDPVDKAGASPAVAPEVVGWQLRKGQQAIPVDAFDIETVSNILSQGNPNCTGITNILKPPALNAEVQRDYIMPQKLYTAVFKAIEVSASGNRESDVHSYTFETSRYGDFTEHIESYIRKITDTETGEEHASPAFFPLVLERNAADLSLINTRLQQTLSNTLSADDMLFVNYATVYDRIVTGILELQAQQAVTGTEFNIIKTKDTDTGTIRILGILVKSPEPFNDPKLPPSEMAGTLNITDLLNSGNQFIHVFSKDNASAFITNSALSLPARMLNITFKQVQYNGSTYPVIATVTVAIDVNNI